MPCKQDFSLPEIICLEAKSRTQLDLIKAFKNMAESYQIPKLNSNSDLQTAILGIWHTTHLSA